MRRFKRKIIHCTVAKKKNNKKDRKKKTFTVRKPKKEPAGKRDVGLWSMGLYLLCSTNGQGNKSTVNTIK
jgi:hypothetical protein